MMKLSAKPISSPGRTEKFPPPLMRFLRSNVGSRSRGRSRSSPMFLRKKATAGETQEPSSPKVTCMGQVRVRRAKQKPKRPGRGSRAGEPTRRRCKWFRDALLCKSCRGTIGSGSFLPDWRKWVVFFQRKGEISEECKEIEPKSEEESRRRVDERSVGDEEEEEEEGKACVSSSDRPPMNALLLTRCRSAPYRSSSLAVRFWGSPLRSEEETEEEEEEEEDTKTEEANDAVSVAVTGDGDKPTSESETLCRESGQEPEMDTQTEEKSGLFEGPNRETTVKSEVKTGEKEEGAAAPGGGSVHPLLLTRCKSEPARTAGEKLDPEMNFWKLRRFGVVADSRSPHVL